MEGVYLAKQVLPLLIMQLLVERQMLLQFFRSFFNL